MERVGLADVDESGGAARGGGGGGVSWGQGRPIFRTLSAALSKSGHSEIMDIYAIARERF